MRMIGKLVIDEFTVTLIQEYKLICKLTGFSARVYDLVEQSVDQGMFVNMLLSSIDEMKNAKCGW